MAAPSDPIRLHIGGTQPHPQWKILDVTQRAEVDFVGSCTDLSQFADNSIAAVYASHVYEHLAYRGELPRALAVGLSVLWSGFVYFAVPLFIVGLLLLVAAMIFAMIEMRFALNPIELEGRFVAEMGHRFEEGCDEQPISPPQHLG